MHYILDCTLRDGGYINNWSFSDCEMKEILLELTKAKIDIVEVGFLQNNSIDHNKSIFSKIENIKKLIPRDKNNTLYAAMIALGKNEIKLDNIPDCNGIIDIIRITFHHSKAEELKAFEYCKILSRKGYKVFMQPVGSSLYSNKSMLYLIKKINLLKPFAFYLVDTLGVLDLTELLKKISFIDKHLNKNIYIGFHSHNNLQLSFSNSIGLINNKFKHKLIIDSSLMGMGRGAGNLPTELITNYLTTKKNKNYSLKPVLKVIDEIISPLQRQFAWGYNSYYYLSAKNKCHPDYASYLLNKQTLPINQVDDLLKLIPDKNKSLFDKNLIKNIYFNHQVKTISATENFNKIAKAFGNRKILILGPGKNIKISRELINKFIKTNDPIIISINAIIDDYNIDYLFVSNRKRYYELSFPIKCKTIFTSNLPFNINPDYIVDYNKLIIKEDEGDNALIILINLLNKVGYKNVWLAGFDGFETGVNNYYNKQINIVDDIEVLNNKNAQISKLLTIVSNGMKLHSLTPSKYIK